jgi:hypothetical protein
MNNASDESKFNAHNFSQNPHNANYFRIFGSDNSSSGRFFQELPQYEETCLDPNESENYDFFPKSQISLQRNPDIKTSLLQLRRSMSGPAPMNLERTEIKLDYGNSIKNPEDSKRSLFTFAGQETQNGYKTEDWSSQRSFAPNDKTVPENPFAGFPQNTLHRKISRSRTLSQIRPNQSILDPNNNCEDVLPKSMRRVSRGNSFSYKSPAPPRRKPSSIKRTSIFDPSILKRQTKTIEHYRPTNSDPNTQNPQKENDVNRAKKTFSWVRKFVFIS